MIALVPFLLYAEPLRRYMLHQRKESNEIDKPKLPFVNGELSILNNSRPPSSVRKTRCILFSRAIELLQMNVSC